MTYLKKFLQVSRQKKWLLLEAYVLLAVFQMVLLLIDFKRIQPHLGQHMYETPKENNEPDRMMSHMVSWAVNTMSRHTFWESKCLVQAMTAKYMLRRRGIKSTLYLGLATDTNKAMIAHAWLRSGMKIVTGAREIRKFTSISSFGDV